MRQWQCQQRLEAFRREELARDGAIETGLSIAGPEKRQNGDVQLRKLRTPLRNIMHSASIQGQSALFLRMLRAVGASIASSTSRRMKIT